MAARIDDDALVCWISDFTPSHDYAPSVREVATFLGVNVSTTHHRLARLRREGKVTWNEGETRTLRAIKEHDARTKMPRRRRPASVPL